MAKPQVFISKRRLDATLQEKDFERPGREMLSALRLDPGDRTVMIKPNVTAGAPRNSGIVTHPAFVGGLVDYFVEDLGMSAKRIFVAETTSPSQPADSRDFGWARSGYTAMSREKQVKLIDLADYGNVRITPENTVHLHNIGISRWAASEDIFYINAPKLKTHNLSVATLCGKNQQGIMIPVVDRHLCSEAWRTAFGRDFKKRSRDWMHVEDHETWQRTIAHMHWDVYLACQPDFNIIEGIVGRDGNAFYLGRNFPTGLVVAGYDLPSVDVVGAYLMGFTTENLVYLKVGVERGICPPSIHDVDVHLVQENGDIVRLDDVSPYVADPKFEVYRDIPADYPKKGLFQEYDPNSEALQFSA
ncbi:MAG: DUF362 domain-containing protein [candidate division Zixibacteria bacterium]|nr:DUF362 domain-containing protein [candidate division Zixibacteria bacterium]